MAPEVGPAGILLAQMGGPADLGQVEPFIRSVFADPAVVPLPGGPRTRRVIGWLIAKVRARTVRGRYREIGGGSPIGEITERQADLLREELRRRGHPVEVAVAMRYTRPGTDDALDRLLALGVQRLVLMPLYPQYSFATTGSSEAELRDTLDQRGVDLPVTVIRSWADHPAFLEATAGLVNESLAAVPGDWRERTVVLFSAHGLPERLVERGDPYPEEIEASMAGVVGRIDESVAVRLGYQSRAGPVRWIGPGSDEVLRELGGQAGLAVVVVPLSFVSDHVETLHELDRELRDVAVEAGVDYYQRSPVLGTRAEVGPVLADVVEDVL